MLAPQHSCKHPTPLRIRLGLTNTGRTVATFLPLGDSALVWRLNGSKLMSQEGTVVVDVVAAPGGYLIVGVSRAIVGEVGRADMAGAIDTCMAVGRGMAEGLDTCTAVVTNSVLGCTTMTVQLPQVCLEPAVGCRQWLAALTPWSELCSPIEQQRIYQKN